MQTILIATLKTLLTKLITEKVLVAIAVHVLEYLSRKTTNELDNKLVEEVKKAL